MLAPATKTRQDLINHALGDLGVLAAGQNPAAEDYDTVDEHVDAFFAQLANRDLPIVDDDQNIPIEWFLDLAMLLANEAASHFGLVGVPAPAGTNPVLDAETRLREITYARPTYETQKALYF